MKERLDLATIKKRAVKGVMSLTFRRVALQAISFLSVNILLARLLEPSVLGVFNIGISIIAFFSFFSDIGLAAALIQKKEAPTREHLTTTFFIQQVLVSILTIIMFVLAPKLSDWYGLGIAGTWLIWGLAVSFFLSSLKVIPSVLLERELKFDLLILPEIVETLVFNLILIGMVVSGYHLWSFVVASVVRGITGTVIMYLIAPWRVGFGLRKEVAKDLLSFGVPFQANSILALLKDRIVPLFVAKVVGATAIGYITWSQAIAFLPLEVMNIIIRVTFPAYSRLQDNKKMLQRAIEKSLFMITLFLYPMLAGLMAIMPGVVEHVVNPKWQPAISSFYLFTFATFWAAISTTFTNALNATGYIKVTLKLMVFWTVLTWILTPVLVFWKGFIGVGITSAIISFTSIWAVIEMKKVVNVSIIRSVWVQFVSSSIMGITVYLFGRVFIRNTQDIFLFIGGGTVMYISLIMLLDRKRVYRELSSVLKRHE